MRASEHLTVGRKILPAITITAGAAGSSAINGAIVDMAGYGAICCVVIFGAIVTGAATSIKFQQDDAAGGGTMEDILGSSQTIVDSADDTIFVTDHIRPAKRYVRLVVSRATQNATVCAIYEQYQADNKPVTQPSGVTVERFKDAIAGTA